MSVFGAHNVLQDNEFAFPFKFYGRVYLHADIVPSPILVSKDFQFSFGERRGDDDVDFKLD
jgi:hypothetical protein